MIRCLLVAVVLLLAGCDSALTMRTGASRSAPPLDGSFNDTDVMFLQMLVPHHRQGVRLAALAADLATDPEIRDFAAAVEATQTDEIADMESWLTEWNQPIAADPDPNAHHGHGDGLHSADPSVVTALAETPAAQFDRAFLTSLTGHQHGAVKLARMELEDGRHPDALDLADRVVESRTAQVKQMATFLATP
ncbi:DUF305 domain-containing protein [Actinophytocola gossypii]|uniref:DUF305 domain-containing protein n=1 Tax=Actinophytocola gossypii TaxID=2812003 RepID=A0ABT2JC45_9PSEU|nr:DUF305 domain-containing protein [Actinophytocola gossypii]MCT2585437.1 DUF305 domain-containing protein [Actinophytocola gossypii]